MTKFKPGDRIKNKNWNEEEWFEVISIRDNTYSGTFVSKAVAYPYYYTVYDIDNNDKYVLYKDNVKCTCGVYKLMGEDADKEFHSDWCDVKLKKEQVNYDTLPGWRYN